MVVMKDLKWSVRLLIRHWTKSQDGLDMKTFVVYVNGLEQTEPIAAADYDKAVMIAEAKYPNRRVQVYLSVMGWHWVCLW